MSDYQGIVALISIALTIWFGRKWSYNFFKNRQFSTGFCHVISILITLVAVVIVPAIVTALLFGSPDTIDKKTPTSPPEVQVKPKSKVVAPVKPLSQAKPYTVISSEDLSFPGRNRQQFNIISPQASNHLEFAETAVKAALDKQDETGADVIYVYLEPSKDLAGNSLFYAIADYAPDGGGNSGDQDWMWEVRAAEKNLTELEVHIQKTWSENRNDYLVDGLVDEPKLVKLIANKLEIPEKDVRLPWITHKKYTPTNVDEIAKAALTKINEAKAKKEAIVKSQFSPWDGSHYGMVKLIKKAMNDPDSYDHVKTLYWENDNDLTVKTTFRGKNGFGGVVVNSVTAKFDYEGNLIQVISQE